MRNSTPSAIASGSRANGEGTEESTGDTRSLRCCRRVIVDKAAEVLVQPLQRPSATFQEFHDGLLRDMAKALAIPASLLKRRW